MITTGIWCDECRRKYVMHMCKNRRLPCRHSYAAAFGVWCQAFGRSGEHVTIEWGELDKPHAADVWIFEGDRPIGNFIDAAAWGFWGMRIRPFTYGGDEEWWVGEWLASRPDAFVRAFLNRWDSYKWTPDWLSFREHPDAKRACALVRQGLTANELE